MNRALVIFLCVLVAGCSPLMRRGEFSLLAADSSGVNVLSQKPVEGRACFSIVKMSTFIGDDVFENAVRDALSKHTGANVLVNVTFTDNGECVDVQGLPGRL
jgi:hypothetical protein